MNEILKDVAIYGCALTVYVGLMYLVCNIFNDLEEPFDCFEDEPNER